MSTASVNRIREKPAPYASSPCYLHEVDPPGASKRPRGVQIKRVYDSPSPADGRRVLVDRLWPRGITKERAALDEWLRDLAPSTSLRKWFGHSPERWAEFTRRYKAELRASKQRVDLLKQCAQHARLTLLYGARDPQFNHAIVLRDAIEKAHQRSSAQTAARLQARRLK
jgi:uncharacterized protein YeaO (DUF488 family)